MKIYKILLVTTLVLGVVYFALDRQLFFYGKNDFNTYYLLPLKLKPVFRYDFEGGFTIEDESGFRLISSGECQYVNSDIKLTIKEIIKYGYNEDKLIAVIEDINGRIYFIECFKNHNVHSKQDLIINVLNEKTLISSEKLKWIELKKNERHIKTVELFRNFIMFIFIVLFIIIVYMMFVKLRNKK